MMQHYTDTKPMPSVIFTDYNDYVLSDVTLPNIILNTMTSNHSENIILSEKIRYLNQIVTLVSGDWMDVSDQLKPVLISKGCVDNTKNVHVRFDLILAAETTYTPEASKDTAYLLLCHLKRDGIALVACKRYYFGVGGGSDAFVNAANHMVLRDEDVHLGLKLDLIREYDDGKSNIRDLWLVQVVER